jgi:hypothetical protein
MKKLFGIVVLMGMSFSAYSVDIDYLGRYGSCRVTCQDADPTDNLTCTLGSKSWSNVETLHACASKAGIYCSASVGCGVAAGYPKFTQKRVDQKRK